MICNRVLSCRGHLDPPSIAGAVHSVERARQRGYVELLAVKGPFRDARILPWFGLLRTFRSQQETNLIADVSDILVTQ